jgi:hypothetical protein
VDSTYEDSDLLGQPVADRVFFAGEATNYEYQGALQAAYLSGNMHIASKRLELCLTATNMLSRVGCQAAEDIIVAESRLTAGQLP